MRVTAFLAATAVAAIGLFTALQDGEARADIIPESGVLAFNVLRDGDAIGTHVIRFIEAQGELSVDIATTVAVKLPLVSIALYRFEHEGHEVWRDGKLVTLKSKTNDDGAAHRLQVLASPDGLMVDGDAGAHQSDLAIIPASLWNPNIITQTRILNTLDGREMVVAVDDLGEEEIKTRHGPVTARHYQVRGDLDRELWYNDSWVLVQVRFKAEDGSNILYALK